MPYKDPGRRREYLREYYQKNKEQIKARTNKYYYEHKERCLERQRKYKEAHSEQYRQWEKEYRRNHLDTRDRREYFKEQYRKYKAEGKVNVWVKARTLPLEEFCELCPDEDKANADFKHHPDYNYPEVTVSVCGSCHNWTRRGA